MYKIVVSPLPARISRFFFVSTTVLALLLLIISHSPTTQLQWHHGININNDIGGPRVSFVADAFSPSQLAISPRSQNQTRRQQQQQQQQNSIRIVTSTPLYASIPFGVDIGNDRRSEETDEDTTPAFLIETISKSPRDTIFKTISNLCIDVFFKELLDPSGKGNVNFLKEWQITYLKTLQAADLERRRDRYGDANEMFLAYEIKRTSGMADALSQPLLLDEELKGAYNMERYKNQNSSKEKKNGNNSNSIKNKNKIYDFIADNDDDDDSSGDCYVRGNLLGFVEITQKPYGLGGAVQMQVQSSSETETTTSTTEAEAADFSFGGGINDRPMRPVLTNLAVLKAARQYGIGSKLLDACEKHVRKGWKMNEIVLEVEDYNTKGLEFYRQRGYEVLFSDPASRRYDIEGFWLNKVRCRREIMRKGIENRPSMSFMESADILIRRIRETVSNF